MKFKIILFIAMTLTALGIHSHSNAEVPRKHKSSFKKIESAIKICAMFSVNKRLTSAERNLKKYNKYKNKGLQKFPEAKNENLSIQ